MRFYTRPLRTSSTVWRRQFVSCLKRVDASEYEALLRLHENESFATLCDLLVERLGDADGVAKAGALLAGWLGSELIVAGACLTVAGSPPIPQLRSRGSKMPIVTIQVTREGTKPGADCVTVEEKAQLIKGVSQVLLEVLNKPLESTFVVIEEVPTDNWGWGGLPALEYRKLKAAKSA